MTSNFIKNLLIEQSQKRDALMETWNKAAQVAEKLPAQLFALAQEDRYTNAPDVVVDDHITINFPYDMSLFPVVRRLLGPGWKRKRMYTSTDLPSLTYTRFKYIHKATGIELALDFNVGVTGATCHRVKTGERFVEAHVEAIYEIVCS